MTGASTGIGLATALRLARDLEVIGAGGRGPDPRLRYPVGWDAEAILAARPGIADEELVAMAALDLDAWKAAWGEAFGVSLG